MESRVQDAVMLFESGFNCAQSVFAAYADLFGMDRETALKLACPMGAGVGRMREVCGTVSAMAMLSGLKMGNTDPSDEEAKTRSYEIVRKMSDAFREKRGSIICRDAGVCNGKRQTFPADRCVLCHTPLQPYRGGSGADCGRDAFGRCK